jgi:hypothetical protein
MSTCIHDNYPEWKPNPQAKHSADNIQALSFMPHNAVEGSMYLDTNTSKVNMYVNGKWIEIKGELVDNTNSLDEFDLITKDGFIKVVLYQEIESGERGIAIYNDEGKELVKNTDECIKYIKENINEQSNLFVEKRILNHLG